MNKHFNKNLIMNEEEEHLFQQSNSCWICKKLIDNDEEKVRYHCHVIEKYRGAAHWSFNIFLKKSLIFIDSMPFMNSSLKKLVKNLSDEDFKYSVEEFGSENLNLLKQKGAYPL